MDLWLGKAVRVQVHYDVGCLGLELKDDIAIKCRFILQYTVLSGFNSKVSSPSRSVFEAIKLR